MEDEEVAQDGVVHMVLEVIMEVIMVDIHLNKSSKCSKILLSMKSNNKSVHLLRMFLDLFKQKWIS